MRTITSRQNAFVLRCRELARAHRPVADAVLLDGPHLVEEARRAGVPIEAVAVGPRLLGNPLVVGLLAELEAAGTEVFEATASVMEAASPVRSPAGIVAIARLGPAALEDVFRNRPALVVGAIGLQDPGNVGAIVRTADAAGATGVVVASGSADPFGWKALRGSAGSVFRVPVAAGVAAHEACEHARAGGVRIVAASPADGQSLDDADLARPTFLLVGGEGPGLPADLLAAADCRLRIPMRAPVESLNVAVAAGVVLFEAARQRRRAAGR